jgi:hypothetical protein
MGRWLLFQKQSLNRESYLLQRIFSLLIYYMVYLVFKKYSKNILKIHIDKIFDL